MSDAQAPACPTHSLTRPNVRPVVVSVRVAHSSVSHVQYDN